MLRLLAYIFLLYLVFRVINSVFRFVIGRPQNTQQGHASTSRGKRAGDINLEHMPDNSKGERKDRFKGGEYIDYEEVD